MKKIQDKIKEYEEEIELGNLTRQRKRFLEDLIEQLKSFADDNPEHESIPTSLEVYCNLHPDADECREYDV
jgi:hypothetical protein